MLIIGEGPARGWLEERLPEAVYTGFLGGTDLARGVASMDVLFFPSVTEAFGNVTLEGMACRLPVVASIATGSSSLVLDGVTGHLITPGDIARFADAIQGYAESAALRAQHGQAGEDRSREYSWDRINQVVADAYARLIRQKSADSPRHAGS